MAMGNNDSDEKTQQKNHGEENPETPSDNNKQIVLYDPKIALQNQPQPEPQPPAAGGGGGGGEGGSNPGRPRGLLKVGAYTVQCAECLKWRLIPTKEKYEEIRENIMEEPFFCDYAKEWKGGNVSCDDPSDLEQDNTRVWAIDKPSISQPPPGWERQLRIRAEGGSKFADVYYISPLGKKLRSTVEVQKYLDEHPEFTSQGVTLSQFSFQIPKPLQQDYVRKRTPSGMPRPLQGIQASPLSWAPPEDPTNFHPAQTDDISPPKKKKARPSAKNTDNSSPLRLSPHNVKIEGPHPPNGVNEA